MSDDLYAALRQIFTLDSFADGCAGAAGGTSAISVFYPLNLIRTRLQTADPNKPAPSMVEVVQDILKDSGPAGLFTGWWAQVVALGSSNFVYFYVYNMLKVIVQKKTKVVITPVMNLAVGAVAGVVNVLMTTPLWMMCTQLATQRKKNTAAADRYTGMWDGLVKTYAKGGVGALWKGLIPNLTLVSNPTIHFFVYERCRLIMSKIATKRGSPISSGEFFLLGAIAKTVATILTYPIQVAQSLLRNDREGKYKGTLDCLRQSYVAAGLWNGWFRGMGAKLWQTVLTAAFQFMAYENIRVIVFQTLTGKQYKPKVLAH